MWGLHGHGVIEAGSDGDALRGLMEEDCRVQIEGPAAAGGGKLPLYCRECGWEGEWDDVDDEEAPTCPDCGEDDPEEHEPSPVDWCNSAAITVGEEEVTVSISVGDPRGAFAFTVRRLDDGRLILHTPYPGEGLPHMGLRELHAGTYAVGEYDPDAETIPQEAARRYHDDHRFVNWLHSAYSDTVADLHAEYVEAQGIEP